MSEMGSPRISESLRERGKAAWAAAIAHPMVRDIAAGAISGERFRRYFQQNLLYLEQYARAIGLITGKAPNVAAADVLSRFLRQIVGTEIPANAEFLMRLGGQPVSGIAAMLPATYAYTRHLLYTAAQGTCAEGLAAVLPCQWSYGELAAPLMSALPADRLCADWIAMFGNSGYAALVDETTGLLDRLACADGSEKMAMDRLAPIFDLSTGYEVQFWDMAYGQPPGSSTHAAAGEERVTLCMPPGSSTT